MGNRSISHLKELFLKFHHRIARSLLVSNIIKANALLIADANHLFRANLFKSYVCDVHNIPWLLGNAIHGYTLFL